MRDSKVNQEARSAGVGVVGVVLAGTHRWNNSAFDRLPLRPLMPVAHRPLISYALWWLSDAGISDVVVCANRETQALQSRLLRHVPQGMTASYQQDPMPRGAAGAIRDASAMTDADTFIVADGTAIPTVELSDLLAAHRASGAAATVVGHSARGRTGNATQVPSGIYVFNRAALDAVPLRGFFDIKENLIPLLHRSGARVVAYAAGSASPRVLDASSYLAVNEWMVERLVTTGEPPEGYVRSGESLIHAEAEIADDAVCVGPVLIGPAARVMSGAVLVGPTSIGCEVAVGRGVLVSRSAIWRRCVLGDASVTDRCILADDTIVPANAEAFRTVMVTSAGREPEAISVAALERREPAPFELLRRMGRLLGGGTPSRSPAAQ
jgi:NDP-sugar pyrophosphorylase family protein